MEIKIVREKINKAKLEKITKKGFKEMIKVVVDIKRKIIAIGGEFHADGEELLIKDGSMPKDIWGANIYLNKPKKERIEFSALINIRPSIDNRSMEIQSSEIKEKIRKIIDKLID